MAYYNNPSSHQQQSATERHSRGSASIGPVDSEGEEVMEYKHQLSSTQPYILREDEKIPLFLVKLLNCFPNSQVIFG